MDNYTIEQLFVGRNAALRDENQQAVDEIQNALDSAMSQRGPVQEPLRGGTPQQRQEQLREIVNMRYGEGGRKVDAETGLPVGVRLKAAFAPTVQEKIKFLREEYGPDAVRIAGEDRRIIVTATDGRSGEVKDYFLDEIPFTAKDMADFASLIPEVMTTVAAGFKVAPKGPTTVWPMFVASTIAEGAGQAVGFAQDAAFRVSQGSDIDSGEIVARRAPMAGASIAIGTFAPLGVQRFLNRTGGKISSQELSAMQNIAREGSEAAGRLSQQLGIDIKQSAAETTGSRALAELEAYMQRVGRITDPGKELEASRAGVPKAVQAFLGEGLEDVVTFGEKAAGTLRKAEQGLVRMGEKQVQLGYAKVLEDVEQVVGKLTAEKPVGAVLAGQNTQGTIRSLVAANKAQSEILYNQVDDALKASGSPVEFVSWENAAKAVKRIRNELPKSKTVEEVVSPIVDAYGRAIKSEKITVRPINLYTDAFSYFDDILAASKSDQSLAASRIARSDMLAALRSGGKFGEGISRKHLTEIAGALSKDIDDSLFSVSGEAAVALKRANKFYRESIESIEKAPVIQRIVSEPADGGFQNAADIAGYFSGGKGKLDELTVLRKLIPPERYNELRRGMVDDIVNGAKREVNGREFIEPSVLQERIKGMSPEFRNELFSGKASVVEKALDEVAALDRLRPKLATPGGLSSNQLAEALQMAGTESFGPATLNIKRALVAEQQRTRTFRNSVVGANRDVLGIMVQDGERFVNDFVLNSRSAAEVQLVMGRLTLEQRDQLSKQTVQILFKRAADIAESTVSSLKSGRNVALKPEQVLKDIYGPQRSVIRAALGPRELGILDDWMMYSHSLASIQKAGGTVGVFSRDTSMNKPLTVAWNNMMAQALYSGAMQGFLKQAARNPGDLKKLSYVLATGLDKNPGLKSKQKMASGLVVPELTKGVVDLYQEWSSMTRYMSEAQVKIYRAMYLPY